MSSAVSENSQDKHSAINSKKESYIATISDLEVSSNFKSEMFLMWLSVLHGRILEPQGSSYLSVTSDSNAIEDRGEEAVQIEDEDDEGVELMYKFLSISTADCKWE